MKTLSKSPWIIHYDGSSCNGCDIEVLACLTPVYDVERLGVLNTGNPKHADIFVVTGSVNEQNKEIVQNIYNQMPDPKVVVAVGICACSGGIFAQCYNVSGGINKVIPVDVYVPGCAARPESIIDGIIKAVGILEEKNSKLKRMLSGLAELVIEEASKKDAKEILELQKLAYQSEAEIYNDYSLAPLNQTLNEIEDDFENKFFLKAVLDGKIVGSVRTYLEKDSCFIGRLVVHPNYQNYGIGKKMMKNIEEKFFSVNRFEIFTGDKSRRNIYFHQKRGYKIFKSELISEKRKRVYLEKITKSR